MWFGGPPSKPGAKPGVPGSKAAPARAAAPARKAEPAVAPREFGREDQHAICNALSKSGRLSYDTDRHPLVKYLKGGYVDTAAGRAPRVIVQARKEIRERHFKRYEAAFILHLDGTIEEIT